MSRYCVIIPTFNNSGTIAAVVERARKVCPDVIVVNDGCTDNTVSELCGFDIKVLTHERNSGKGKALKTGLEYACKNGYTHAITMDADGQHFPEDIPALTRMSHEHPDCTLQVRICRARIRLPTGSLTSGSVCRRLRRLMTRNPDSVSIRLINCTEWGC